MRFARFSMLIVALSAVSCASLGGLSQIIQPPRFEQADGQPAELRILGPSRTMPVGGAGVRVWLKVTNPNAFGFTLSTLDAALSLEGSRAANADFRSDFRCRRGRSRSFRSTSRSVLPICPDLPVRCESSLSGGGLHMN